MVGLRGNAFASRDNHISRDADEIPNVYGHVYEEPTYRASSFRLSARCHVHLHVLIARASDFGLYNHVDRNPCDLAQKCIPSPGNNDRR